MTMSNSSSLSVSNNYMAVVSVTVGASWNWFTVFIQTSNNFHLEHSALLIKGNTMSIDDVTFGLGLYWHIFSLVPSLTATNSVVSVDYNNMSASVVTMDWMLSWYIVNSQSTISAPHSAVSISNNNMGGSNMSMESCYWYISTVTLPSQAVQDSNAMSTCYNYVTGNLCTAQSCGNTMFNEGAVWDCVDGPRSTTAPTTTTTPNTTASTTTTTTPTTTASTTTTTSPSTTASTTTTTTPNTTASTTTTTSPSTTASTTTTTSPTTTASTITTTTPSTTASTTTTTSPYSALILSLIHISEPTRLLSISYAVFCLKKKKKTHDNTTHVPQHTTQIQMTIIHMIPKISI
eukprot:TRINITY_DN7136_c0_g1_i2.p1 TRINITY_DN7136_c0_g1~~TRINITY_DN7136_c0_g1_i2.p1  ORF type:complete len:347 (+),score=52.75 TRINITY_DN7136_c0_g1_i2:366-1406(+)